MPLTLDYSRKTPWGELPRTLRLELVDYGRPDLRCRSFLLPHPDLPADDWAAISEAAFKACSQALSGLARPDSSGHGAWMEFTEAARYCTSHTFHFLPLPEDLAGAAADQRRRDDFVLGLAHARTAIEAAIAPYSGLVRTFFEPPSEAPSAQSRFSGLSSADEAAALALARIDELFLIESAMGAPPPRPRRRL